jgi:hypothetical protein
MITMKYLKPSTELIECGTRSACKTSAALDRCLNHRQTLSSVPLPYSPIFLFCTTNIMTTFLDLPPELVLNILDQFNSFWQASPDVFDVQDDRVKTLLSLTCVCRALRQFAQPVLHSVIGVSRHTEKDAHRTLTQLTRTINCRPDLAHKTRTLSLKLGGLTKASGVIFFPKCSSNPRGEPIAEDLLCNLVPSLQNVTSLTWMTDDRRDSFWRKIQATTRDENTFFPNIQTLSVSPYFSRRIPCMYTCKL